MTHRPIANGLPALGNFFFIPHYARAYMHIRDSGVLDADNRRDIETTLAHSLDFAFHFPEWGAHNRAIVRAVSGRATQVTAHVRETARLSPRHTLILSHRLHRLSRWTSPHTRSSGTQPSPSPEAIMKPTPFLVISLALTVQACDDTAAPTTETAELTAGSSIAQYEYNPPTKFPPVQPKPTFWTCAAEAEGRFAAAATQILLLETQALLEPDPFRQAVLWAEVARRKMQAQSALYFALTVCVDTYGVPSLFALPDDSGNLVFMPFSVGVYHAYLVEKYLEKPE